MTLEPVFTIVPSVQQYDWGKIGINSKVAQFAHASNKTFVLNEHGPYAELWMGTHPSGPSHVLGSDTPLSRRLAASPTLVGEKVVQEFNCQDGGIPFLFKVLAIQKALSIQTHPDKPTAFRLHAERPDIYKDANHKPEMAIAITPFSALCGFRPLPQISEFLLATPELSALVPPSIVSKFTDVANSANPEGLDEKAALRDVFSAIMTAEPDLFKSELLKLVERYRNGNDNPQETEVKELVLTLNDQFPADIGVFCAFVLNYVKLQPGEALFLGAGEPHAYISGDIMECMATSDNVVRAGLTPKLRDIPNLISGLTYVASPASKHQVFPQPFNRGSSLSKLYDPPTAEFSVIHVNIPKTSDVSSTNTESHSVVNGPSLAIATSGAGRVAWNSSGSTGEIEIVTGQVLFVGAGTELVFETSQGLELFRAFTEV